MTRDDNNLITYLIYFTVEETLRRGLVRGGDVRGDGIVEYKT